jgi:hypothetical protein
MLQAPIDGQEREKDGDDKPNNGGARHRKLALAINRPCKSPLERSRTLAPLLGDPNHH